MVYFNLLLMVSTAKNKLTFAGLIKTRTLCSLTIKESGYLCRTKIIILDIIIKGFYNVNLQPLKDR